VETPVKVSRSDVGGIVLRARFLFFSNGWLERERLYALALANGAPTSDLPQP
jgi:hypothetical protein